MSDAAALVMALAAAAGALAPHPLPRWPAALLIVVALVARRPAVLVLGVALAASALSARSWAGLDPPLPRTVDGVLTLVGDPQDVSGALRVEVRVGRRRAEAWARGRDAGRLRQRLAGERVRITGQLQPVPESDRARAAPRHLSARLTVTKVGEWSAGNPASLLANSLRRTLLSGATSLPPPRLALFSGFVLGDDRGQPPEVAFDFRASGLAHLLVVSGQNVAFVLAVASPFLRRLRLQGRLVAGCGVLLLFGILTRWEPSVLRAVAMAAVTLFAGTIGRPASSLRVLALAVTGLLLIDPLLVHSVGFRLSVGACTGIALFSKRITALVPGPRPIAEALGVTLAAQAGVAPVMVPVFGGLPVAALIANLVALPAAGPLMVWGLAAGLPAGVVGGGLATLLHLPTRAMVAWVAGVARVTGSLPLGQLGLVHVAVLAVAVAVLAAAVVRHRPRLLAVGALAAAGALVHPTVALIRPPPVDARSVGRGATLWRDGQATVVVLDGAAGAPDRLMSALQAVGVRNLDVLVASRPGTNEARAAEVLQRRFPAGVVLGPPKSKVLGAVVPPDGSDVHVGALTLHIEHADDRLAVTVSRPP
ncbi:MAG: ComEC/Rec2 family competence protein [Acidimicrobiales bacterium]